jgi:protein gp37
MSKNSKIEWTDHTWNPWIGCTKVSPACVSCYAERSTPARTLNIKWGPMAPRHRTSEGYWTIPKHWNKQHEIFFVEHGRKQRVFCASLADVFDNEVPVQWRMDMFSVIAKTPNLDWLILTKRIGNVLPMCAGDSLMFDTISDHVWLGATVVNQQEADRDIPKLQEVPAAKRFLSLEPLLGPVDISRYLATGLIDWVIVGGESGPNARPMHPEWPRSLRDQCEAANIPFFFKQWGEWGQYVNEEHYTHCGEEKHPHAWVDRETAEQGLCWVVDDDGTWANSTGEPRMLSEDQQSDDRNIHPAVAVVGRFGKKEAGRLLDSILHEGSPA